MASHSSKGALPKDALKRAAELFALVAADDALHAKLGVVADQALETLRRGGTLFTCGNGGSAAQATHVTGELIGTFFDRSRPPMRAIALGFDPSSLTAIANDFDYKMVFSRQLRALGKAGDVLWAFSTSGNSPNVLAALETARFMGISTVLFCNHHGGQAHGLADHMLSTPESLTPRIQELHLLYTHVLCEMIEGRLEGGKTMNS
jgi:D-sedoheptulose 7-phosphate isomerase